MAEILSGTAVAKKLLDTELRPRVEKLRKSGVVPRLVVIFVGENPASKSYIRQKEKFAELAGIQSEIRRFPESVGENEILAEIEKINRDPKIHGVIVQLPVPEGISVAKILEKINPAKDVDGFSAENVGKLFLGEKCLQSCTPRGIIRLLEADGERLEGRRVVVVGRSNIVGKPVAMLALEKNATVKICHSRTKNLLNEIADAEILIVAVGKPEFLRGEDLPKNSVVVDVGIHRKNDGKLCGDVHFESAERVVRKITPVPGGVGPMTVFSLIENTIQATENAREIANL